MAAHIIKPIIEASIRAVQPRPHIARIDTARLDALSQWQVSLASRSRRVEDSHHLAVETYHVAYLYYLGGETYEYDPEVERLMLDFLAHLDIPAQACGYQGYVLTLGGRDDGYGMVEIELEFLTE